MSCVLAFARQILNVGQLAPVMALTLFVWVNSAQALHYGASLNQAEWRLELSPFECKMWQPIPYFGDAVFSNRAGEEQIFYLAPTRPNMKAGKAMLVAAPPVWDESKATQSMGYVGVKNSERPIELDKKYAYQLLHELYSGMSPHFTRQSWYKEGEPIELSLSSVNFRKAYRQYRDCLATLLPANFEQINRSRLYFYTAKHELTPASKTKLDHVVQYVKADPSVSGFFIDGHTDSVGRRVYNLDLSKRRAEAVTEYLVANGVDEALITTRYHGERYPVASNASAAGRSQNRRVTLRLERDNLSMSSQ